MIVVGVFFALACVLVFVSEYLRESRGLSDFLLALGGFSLLVCFIAFIRTL